MLDFTLASHYDVAQELGARLRAARLACGLQQTELAAQAGVSTGTVAALERRGQATLASLIRVVQALGLIDEMSGLFVPQVNSIADMEREAASRRRKRAPRRARGEQ